MTTPDPSELLSGTVAFARVSDDEITIEACTDAVETTHAGAVVTFAGIVRDHDEGRGVLWLHYTQHPSAGAVIAEVAAEVAAAHPGTRIAALHRVGRLGLGDLALACAVASAHRAEAFAACSALVDEIKNRVPIWKEQGFTDGSTEWVAALE
jgi:molybdopterin synthase catalytic subunit